MGPWVGVDRISQHTWHSSGLARGVRLVVCLTRQENVGRYGEWRAHSTQASALVAAPFGLENQTLASLVRQTAPQSIHKKTLGCHHGSTAYGSWRNKKNGRKS